DERYSSNIYRLSDILFVDLQKTLNSLHNGRSKYLSASYFNFNLGFELSKTGSLCIPPSSPDSLVPRATKPSRNVLPIGVHSYYKQSDCASHLPIPVLLL